MPTLPEIQIRRILYPTDLSDGARQAFAYAVNLANLFLLHGVPVKAAKVLEKEVAAENIKADVRNLRLLSQAWYSAREDRKAIPPLKQAAELGEDLGLGLQGGFGAEQGFAGELGQPVDLREAVDAEFPILGESAAW